MFHIPNHILVLIIAGLVISSSIGILYIFEPNNPIFCAFIPKLTQTDCNYYPKAHYYDNILQLYPHKQGYGLWSLEGEKNLQACPFNSNCQVVPVGGGWYTDKGGQNNIRNEVPANPAYLEERPAVKLGGMGPYDQGVWRAAGYMDSPTDWKNIEISSLFYLPPGSGKDAASYGPPGVDYVLRGGVNEDNYPQTCLAQNYHVGYFPTGADGGAKVERDIEHTAGYNAGQITASKLTNQQIPLVGTGKVFGFKVVIYNNHDNTQVRIDAYLDTTGSGSNWKLIYSYIDDGHKPEIDSVRGDVKCPGLRPDLPVTFGGPLSGLRLNWSGAYFRNFVISEIIPPVW